MTPFIEQLKSIQSQANSSLIENRLAMLNTALMLAIAQLEGLEKERLDELVSSGL